MNNKIKSIGFINDENVNGDGCGLNSDYYEDELQDTELSGYEELNLSPEVATSLNKYMKRYGHRTTYDKNCKELISHIDILAWILKECVNEFKKYDINTIKSCIDKNIMIDSEYVNHADIAITDNIEDNSETEGSLKFDIKFRVKTPENVPIELVINIENQNNYSPGYPLQKRAIYYVSRLISSQQGTIFGDNEYDKILKVYSIWICTDFTLKNPSITRYNINETVEVKNPYVKSDKSKYDLMEIVIIRLCEDPEKNKTPILRLLGYLLGNKYSMKERVNVLNNDFNIKMRSAVKGEDCMHTADYIFIKGYKEGVEGSIVSLIIRIYSKCKDTSTVSNLMDVPEDYVIDVINKYNSGEIYFDDDGILRSSNQTD